MILSFYDKTKAAIASHALVLKNATLCGTLEKTPLSTCQLPTTNAEFCGLVALDYFFYNLSNVVRYKLESDYGYSREEATAYQKTFYWAYGNAIKQAFDLLYPMAANQRVGRRTIWNARPRPEYPLKTEKACREGATLAAKYLLSSVLYKGHFTTRVIKPIFDDMLTYAGTYLAVNAMPDLDTATLSFPEEDLVDYLDPQYLNEASTTTRALPKRIEFKHGNRTLISKAFHDVSWHLKHRPTMKKGDIYRVATQLYHVDDAEVTLTPEIVIPTTSVTAI